MPGRRPAWVDSALFPFESRFARIRGHTVHYVDEGRGPVLLLYHGNPSWSFLYREMIAGLRDEFRCIAFDHPGMGLSTAADGFGYRAAEYADVAEAFVEELDLRGVIPVVQDWGGPIGLAAAARHPGRYRALVIGNTWGWPAATLREKVTHRVFAMVWGGPLGRIATDRLNLFVRQVVPAGHKRVRLSGPEMAHYLAPFSDVASRAPCRVFPAEIVRARGLLTEVEAGLVKLSSLPALILWADRDFAFKDDERRRWQAAFPGHRTHVLKGAGHFFQDDAAGEVCDTIKAWWASLPA